MGPLTREGASILRDPATSQGACAEPRKVESQHHPTLRRDSWGAFLGFSQGPTGHSHGSESKDLFHFAEELPCVIISRKCVKSNLYADEACAREYRFIRCGLRIKTYAMYSMPMLARITLLKRCSFVKTYQKPIMPSSSQFLRDIFYAKHVMRFLFRESQFKDSLSTCSMLPVTTITNTV